MSVGLGVFGKIETYAEFISAGMSSPTGQAFERWLQMANDQVARAGAELPHGPIGFCFRDEGGSSVLVGVMVGSRDKVGRRFPLSAFCEVVPQGSVPLAGLVEVLRPLLTQLSMLAATSSQTDPNSLKQSLQNLEAPGAAELSQQLQDCFNSLDAIEFRQLLSRLYPEGKNAAYGTSVLLRACDRAVHDGVKRPITLDVSVTSDVELSFWLASAEARLAGRLGPVSAFWDVQQQRALIIPGVPDSNTLLFMGSVNSQNSKLWRTTTSSKTAQQTARDQLGADICGKLDDAESCSALSFVRALVGPG